MNNIFNKLVLIIIIAAVIQNCTATKMTNGYPASQVYNKNIEKISTLFERTARNGSLYAKVISKKAGEVTYRVNMEDITLTNVQTIPSALIHIISLDTHKTALMVDEPHYSFTVPEHKKAHYKRIIMRELDELLTNS